MFESKILRLYFVAGTQDCRHLPQSSPEERLLAVLAAALQAGITCYQFREKGAGALQDTARRTQLAASCRDLCRRHGMPFFINDDVPLALELGADGVHIGQDDMPLPQALALCRGRLHLGLSHHSLAELARSQQEDGLAYLALGPIFATRSKADAAAPLGTSAIRAARAAGIDRPLVAIGGIDTANAAEVYRAGADGIAVISAITQADDIAAAVRRLRAAADFQAA